MISDSQAGWAASPQARQGNETGRKTAESFATLPLSGLTSQLEHANTVLSCRKKRVLYSQGEEADAVFYIEDGRVKLTVISPQGKEATVAILERGAFFGEACLAGEIERVATAVALDASSVVRIDRDAMARALRDDSAFSSLFMGWLLSRGIRIQEDLVDQLFNSAEKRLARILLLMAHFGESGAPTLVISRISQETLAEMIGTTRSRVSFFLNRFKKCGYIECNGEIHVHSSLLQVVLRD